MTWPYRPVHCRGDAQPDAQQRAETGSIELRMVRIDSEVGEQKGFPAGPTASPVWF
jgi:hypothetical protein